MSSPVKLTPMLRQYMEIKESHQDTILFYRMGDFYEMFFDDAEIAARTLNITLTSRSHKNDEHKIPMCGVPFHAVNGYLAKMVNAGFRVAICEQVENPKEAKGIVRRKVTRIITPGVTTNEELLDEKANRFICALAPPSDKKGAKRFGISLLDASTGTFLVNEISVHQQTLTAVVDEICRYQPAELLLPQGKEGPEPSLEPLVQQLQVALGNICLTQRPEHQFDPATARTALTEHFRTTDLAGFGCDHMQPGLQAAGALLTYIQETQKTDLDHIRQLTPVHNDQHLIVDESSRRNLELIETLIGAKKQGTLLSVMDKTVTPMGARLLRQRLLFPLQDMARITARLDAVEELNDRKELRSDIRVHLNDIYDMERLCSRLVLGHGNARDMVALKVSLGKLPALKNLLATTKTALLLRINEQMDALEDLFQLVARTIRDDAPVTLREGNLIQEGYHEELDRLILLLRDGKQLILDLETKEREQTGITKLKVGYNKVFGYYFELSRTQASEVPDHWIRKQTLVNAERFITPELKELENAIASAQERRLILEYELFQEIRGQLHQESRRILDCAHHVARLDVLACLAETAARNRYIKPSISDDGQLFIREGRHPVIEQALEPGRFVPNDVRLDQDQHELLIITGPNMAGKSTILRQTALIVLLAHIGSFVPADEASICLVDRIFTRVGATDDLRRGQSTFMVEMNETANILNNASARSLVILDEIGRGTSTYDGLAIAWAVTEALASKGGQGVKTLFATHYHELIELAASNPRIKNYSIAVREWNDSIIFLHKLVEGGTSRSYGIQVASLAGVPDAVIRRAREILRNIEETEQQKKTNKISSQRQTSPTQLALFRPKKSELEQLLGTVKPDEVSPRQALDLLYEAVRLVNKNS
ncbi:MAG: DNA mismatch repair protein MutS [Desulfobulbus propionicus]|nr:MAG: DNA mismatch repair protein MutS [Desulfobulbus propionicus]